MASRRTVDSEGRRERHAPAWLLVGVLVYHALLAGWLAVGKPKSDQFAYDERFNLENIVGSLTRGQLEPINHWYAPLTYFPQLGMLWLLQTSGLESLRAVDHRGRITRLGLTLCRSFGIVYGLLSLWLTYRLGQHLQSRACGVLAALILASSPWMIRASAVFKPDGLLLFTTLLGLAWCLSLPAARSWRPYARAGLGLGLATGAKLNGILLAPCLAVAALCSRPKKLSDALVMVGRLAAAAVVAGLVFVAAYPWLEQTLSYLKRIQAHYDRKAEPLGMLGHGRQVAMEMVSQPFLGPFIGSLGLAGGIFLLWMTWRRRTELPAPVIANRLILFAFPCCYVLAMATITRYPKSNNWLQILPFVALGGAFLGIHVARLLRRRWGRSAAIPWLVLLTVSALAAGPRHVYGEMIPTTDQRATHLAMQRLGFSFPRLVAYQGPDHEAPHIGRVSSGPPATLVPLDAITSQPRELLDRFDLLLLPLAELDGPAGPVFLAGRPPRTVMTLEPGWLSLRGRGLALIAQPWRPFGEEALLESVGEWQRRGRFPATWSVERHVTVQISLPRPSEIFDFKVESQPITMYQTAEYPQLRLYVSERFLLPAAAASFELTLSNPQTELDVRAWRWLPPASTSKPPAGP